ncbi:MAG TPA: hypothetical protein DCX14_01630, partial [Flavobacteriales bacterium]|nr:hypothetical protein [Flavobacteriales bacterium]
MLRRIAIPYALFEILYLEALCFAPKVGFQTSNIVEGGFANMLHLLLISPIGGYWYLHALVILQLGTLFCRYLFKESFLAWLWFILIMGVSVYLGLLKSFVPAYFFAGILLSKLAGGKIQVANSLCVTIVSFLFAAL